MLIRPVHPDDAEQLYRIVSHPAVARTLMQLPSMEFSETEAFLADRRPGKHRLVAEIDGSVVGSGSLSHNQRARMNHMGTLGLMVHQDYWGQGVGSALVGALMDLADNWLNLMRVELDVFADNPAAIHVYQKHGFVIEGTRRMVLFGDGRWHDEHLMARLRGVPDRGEPKDVVLPERKTSPPTAPQAALIRPLRREDAEGLHQMWRHPAVARTTLQLPSMEMFQVMDRIDNPPKQIHRLVAELDGHPVGIANMLISQNQRTGQKGRLGMMVHPDHWGKGIGTQLMAALVDLADNWLNVRRMELDVNVDNPAAIRLYQNFDFVIEGTKRYHNYGDGRWADSHFMARLRGV